MLAKIHTNFRNGIASRLNYYAHYLRAWSRVAAITASAVATGPGILSLQAKKYGNRRQTECNQACLNCRGAKEEKPQRGLTRKGRLCSLGSCHEVTEGLAREWRSWRA